MLLLLSFDFHMCVCLPLQLTCTQTIESRKMQVEANLTKLVLLQVGLELGVIAFGKFLPRFMSHFLPFFSVTKPPGLLLECSIWELHRRQSIYKETQDIFGRNDLRNHMCVQFLTQVPIPGGAKLWEAKQVGFLGGSTVKNPPAVQEVQKTWIRFLGREDLLEEAWQPTPVFLSGEFHGQRSLVGYSPWGHKELGMTETTEHACISRRSTSVKKLSKRSRWRDGLVDWKGSRGCLWKATKISGRGFLHP